MKILVRISKIELLIKSGKIEEHMEVSKTFSHYADEYSDINKLLSGMEEYLRTRPEYGGWVRPFETQCEVTLSEWWFESQSLVFSRESAKLTKEWILGVFKIMCEGIPQKDVCDLDFDDYLVRQFFREWM
jgi:hypothetical protein